MSSQISIKGAREHNLKNVSLELPRDALIVFTGISGSGKSSLAFDTIYAEGQRRYVESLSSYARQFLGQMEKPDVEFIEGLSPAISIDQKSASRNPRSTVGTITEVYDYLRLLYARIGKPHCHQCGRAIERQTVEQVVDRILEWPEGARLVVLAPVVQGRKGEYESLLGDLARKGFARARVDGEIRELTEKIRLERYKQHTIEVVVDRIVLKKGIRSRLADSLETATGLTNGIVTVEQVDGESQTFSQHFACMSCGISFDELAPRMFSFNTPYGACPRCTGLGTRLEVDPSLIVADPDLSVSEGAIGPWAGARLEYFDRLLAAVCDEFGIDADAPWRTLTAQEREVLLHGSGGRKVHVRYKSRYGRVRSYHTAYEGVIPWLRRRYDETDSDASRQRAEQYMREIPCPECKGARLRPESRAVTIDGLGISELCSRSVREALLFAEHLNLNERERHIAERILKEVRERLGFLVDVGLDYLSLSRAAATLAGGEAQRIRLATQIGSGLVGVLYILDEPSIGLHQRDNRRLITTLVRLRDLGNTLIVVEHDEDTVRTADYVVDIGPGAGEHGGEVVYAGPLEGLLEHPTSLTGRYLSGRAKIGVPVTRRSAKRGAHLTVTGPREHNLKGDEAKFALGCFNAVTGVSGSGKSTLVHDILYQALMVKVYKSKLVPGKHKRITGIDQLDKVILIDQSPIGRTPRSNPATYTGVFDHVRKLFAQTTEAKRRGYGPGRFSFNVRGGRCEACAGDGTSKIVMHFLPDIYVACEVCKGRRYNRETLEVRWKGKTICEVLESSVEDALGLFEAIPPIRRHLQTLVDVGLGYIRLGQPAPTLSGGEAQRVKLASELAKRATGKTLYMLDEPTTGLHFEDIKRLLEVLHRLVDAGNTVVVIEHNLDVIKTADHIIDLGPEGGDGGGHVVVSGTPEAIAACEGSHTGRFLSPLLAPAPRARRRRR
ncbi:MAG TPA: excinuclease ABC subunit UvrA [Actinomycetota bacterium]|nr:excinuclease ABC subunit UvrA [Actinomycetota bacterium]